MACATPEAVLLAPTFEELLFRFLVFYVVLQRSRSLRFTVVLLGCLFAALHLGSAWPLLRAPAPPLDAVPSTGETEASWWLAPIAAGMQADGAATASWTAVSLQLLVAAVAGWVYTLLFAASGSLLLPLAVHAGNNAAAAVTLAVNAVAQLRPEMRDDVAAVSGSCRVARLPLVSPALLLSLAAQLVVYVLAAGAVARGLQTALQSEASAAAWLRETHPLVMGGEGDGARIEPAPAPAPAAGSAGKASSSARRRVP